jgi:hypothetical protein
MLGTAAEVFAGPAAVARRRLAQLVGARVPLTSCPPLMMARKLRDVGDRVILDENEVGDGSRRQDAEPSGVGVSRSAESEQLGVADGRLLEDLRRAEPAGQLGYSVTRCHV